MRVGGFRQVAWCTFLRRHRKKIAARDRDHALAIRSQVHRFKLFRRVYQRGTPGDEVFLDLDRYGRGLSAAEIVTPDVACLFEDNRVLADGWKLDVKILERSELLRLLVR